MKSPAEKRQELLDLLLYALSLVIVCYTLPVTMARYF